MSLPRALLLNVCTYTAISLYMISALPTLVLPRRVLMAYIRGWGHIYLWIARVVGGIHVSFSGIERIPAGPLLIAAKHQSMWETFALLVLMRDPCFILKRELIWYPLFGWFALKSRQVPLDRRGGAEVKAMLNRRASEEIRRDAGRQVLLFPEGTRRPAGALPAYRRGISFLYESLQVPCVPVALNSGLYWPRHSLKMNSGTIRVEILEPIPPGLPREEFFAILQEQIETASDRLLAQGRAELGLAPATVTAASEAAR